MAGGRKAAIRSVMRPCVLPFTLMVEMRGWVLGIGLRVLLSGRPIGLRCKCVLTMGSVCLQEEYSDWPRNNIVSFGLREVEKVSLGSKTTEQLVMALDVAQSQAP